MEITKDPEIETLRSRLIDILTEKNLKIKKLEVENKELKIEIQNLHRFIKKHIRSDIYGRGETT